MMWSCIAFQFIFSLMIIKNINGLSSPLTQYTTYNNSIELRANMSDLWWSVDIVKKEITFELHMKTTGWIAFGISLAGNMSKADIGIGWVNQTGSVMFQDRYLYGSTKAMLDNTTNDWFPLQAREENGWTAIQFKRLVDTCDSMDVPIKSGSNILIFAWDPADPDSSELNGDITFDNSRRGSVVVPLQSYSQPPSKQKLAGLDTFEFRVNNYTVPSNRSIFYCKIFKIPNNFPQKRHVIAREALIEPAAKNVLYHLTINECDPAAVFPDNDLPSGVCDDNITAYSLCTSNIILAWAVGGDYLLEYPDEAGLPIGLNYSTKYYMLQMNYYNPQASSNYTDNSGVRFYVGNQSRPYDIGAFTFGVESVPSSLAIPPNVNEFLVNSYCAAAASLNSFSKSGVTVVSYFGHTHLQGKSLYTKLVRNKTAVEYLFNAESYDPNYQFEHRLPQPIQIYPGDEFAVRCVYNTVNKTSITLGGRRPDQEMCVQVFNYYPRVDNFYTCASTINPQSWASLMNVSASSFNQTIFTQWLLNINWTSQLTNQWQIFYNNASLLTAFGRAGHYNISAIPSLPTYTDLNIENCTNQQMNATVIGTSTTNPTTIMNTIMTTASMIATNPITTPSGMGTTINLNSYQAIFVLLLLNLFLMNGIII